MSILQAANLECLVKTEIQNLNFLLGDFDDTLTKKQEELSDLCEETRICEKVNTTRFDQMKASFMYKMGCLVIICLLNRFVMQVLLNY